MIQKTLLWAICLLWVGNLSAQQAITSAAGSASNSSLGCTFVFGQMIAANAVRQSEYVFYPAVIFPSGSFETGISEISSDDWRCYVTNSHLHLVLQGTMRSDLSCEIYNMQGVAFFKGNLKMQEQEIPLVNYPNGVYILAIKEKNQTVETIKFIKR